MLRLRPPIASFTEKYRGQPVAFHPDARDGDRDGDHAVIVVEPPPLAILAARLGRIVSILPGDAVPPNA